MKIIRPEHVAAKLAALRNFESPKFAAAVKARPRLVELAWFIQWQSLQSGGLEKFIEGFLDRNAARLETQAMHRIGKTGQPYDAAQRQDAIADFPSVGCLEAGELQAALYQFNEEMRGNGRIGCVPMAARPNLAFVNNQNHSYFHGFCKRLALASLPSILERFCAVPDAWLPDVFYFRDLPGALIEEMDSHAARVMDTLAPTVVAKQVLSALEFAWNEKAAVKINGDTRFGKTESAKSYCAAFPGRARLVLTPQSNWDRDLIAAVADALGVENTLQTTQRELKERVEFVLRHAGLMIVFDEAHYLFPQRYTRTSPPMRLNWVRGNLMDPQCPVALLTTPQGFDGARRKFVHTTGYNVDQFNGRIAREVNLPESLSPDDLRAVVNVKLPGLPENFLQRITGHALSSGSYVFAVEKICKNARQVAREREAAQSGIQPENPKITLADLEQGIELAGFRAPANPMLRQAAPPSAPIPRAASRPQPSPAPQSATTPAPPVAESNPPARRRASASDILPAPRRETSPVLTPA